MTGVDTDETLAFELGLLQFKAGQPNRWRDCTRKWRSVLEHEAEPRGSGLIPQFSKENVIRK